MENFVQELSTNFWLIRLIWFVIGYSLLLIGLSRLKQFLHARHVRRLQRRFTNPADVQRILNQTPWQGETLEQLRLSFGARLRPAGSPYGSNTLKVPRTKTEAYIISLQGDQVSGWQLLRR